MRPPCLPALASRRVRDAVARGSMPYSAVTQPRPCPLSQGGRRSFEGGRHQHMRVAELHQAGTLAYLTTAFEADRAHFSG